MTRPTPASGAPLDSARARPWFWVVPALTFAVGLLLGGTVMATAGDPKDDAAAAPRPFTTATVSPAASSGDRTITVPASCEQGLQPGTTSSSRSSRPTSPNGLITIALNAPAGAQSPDHAAATAGALITSLSTLAVYILLGRWFIGGLTASSVKS